jgi:serine/threonine-protein kinase
VIPPPGTAIGHYRIDGPLARGGMGQVYAGWDETLDRPVALKSIRPDHRLSAEARARLLGEARVLSQLAHPNICRIYDCVEGQEADYLVLELVAGEKLGDAVKRGMGFRQKLRIAEEIAAVLVAAHGKGIAHRDLKPDNIMLDEEGRVKVLDFGLSGLGPGPDGGVVPLTPAPAEGGGHGPHETAALEEGPPPSGGSGARAGAVLGTLGHMSPEQARGEPTTTASDLYSFGLLLQELFTGQKHYDPSLDRAARLERARAGVTLPAEGIDPDLAALIERLKSPVPAARPTAVDTAERLAWIRTKPARRRRRALAAGGVAALALFGAAMALLAARAQRAERKAESEAAAAERVSAFLTDLFAVSDPSESRGNSITAREILDRGAHRVRAELAGQPLVQARMMNTMGGVYLNLGLFGQAEQLLTEARRARERLLPSDHPDLARTLNDLSQLYYVQARYAEAVPLCERALAIREGALGPDHPDTAESLSNLATLRRVQGRTAEAEQLHRRALAVWERALGPGDPAVAQALNNFGFLYWQDGRRTKAAPLFDRALAIREKALPFDHLDLAESLNNMAAVRLEQGRVEEAEKLQRRALAVMEKALGPDHPDVATPLLNLASFVRREGGWAEAEALLGRALAIQERALGPEHPRMAYTLHELALLRQAEGRDAEALDLCRKALAIHDRTPDADPLATADALDTCASLLRRAGRSAEAAPLEVRAKALKTGS